MFFFSLALQINQLVDYVPAEGENGEPHNEVANIAEIEAWILKDTQAQMLIYTNIEPLFQVSIEGSIDAHEMWTRLLAEYASVSTSNVRLILGKFHSYKMNPEHSVSTHINVYRQIAEELRNVGEPQSDNMVISKILETLPPSYSCIDTVWSNTPAANQTMPNFIAKVTEEERKIKERSNGVESHRTLHSLLATRLVLKHPIWHLLLMGKVKITQSVYLR